MIDILDNMIDELKGMTEANTPSWYHPLNGLIIRMWEFCSQNRLYEPRTASVDSQLEFTGNKNKIMADLKIMRDQMQIRMNKKMEKKENEKREMEQMELKAKLQATNKQRPMQNNNKGAKSQTASLKNPNSNRIFIVHGHNDKMKLAVARSIEKLGLVAIILHEQPNAGGTIIEKIDKYSNVGFAIILLSPDDYGYEKGERPEQAKFRARQNVILELGYFLGKLGRNRVVALYMEDKKFEMPSDFNGVTYIPFDNADKWQFDLVKELKACGYTIDANKLLG